MKTVLSQIVHRPGAVLLMRYETVLGIALLLAVLTVGMRGLSPQRPSNPPPSVEPTTISVEAPTVPTPREIVVPVPARDLTTHDRPASAEKESPLPEK